VAFLEGIHAFAQDVISQQWLDFLAVHDIGCPAQKVAYVELEAGVAENADGLFRIEVDEDVNIASGMSLAAGQRSEYTGVLNTEPTQLDFMSLKSIEDGLQIHIHESTKALKKCRLQIAIIEERWSLYRWS